jgi:hypothetical protein
MRVPLPASSRLVYQAPAQVNPKDGRVADAGLPASSHPAGACPAAWKWSSDASHVGPGRPCADPHAQEGRDVHSGPFAVKVNPAPKRRLAGGVRGRGLPYA